MIAETPLARRFRDLINRCSSFLGNGGFFNPEMMEQRKATELVLDCRDLVTDLEAAPSRKEKDVNNSRSLLRDFDKSSDINDLTKHDRSVPAPSANGSAETLREVERHIDAARAQMNDDVDFADREYHRGLHDAYRHVRNLLRAGESQPTAPRDEWRLDDRGCLDDVVVEDVATFRLERMADDHIWGAVDRHDGSRTVFNIGGDRRARISLTHEHEPAVSPVVEGARSPAEDLVAIRAALTEALRLERAGRQGFREQLCDELGIRSTAREEDAIDAIRQVKAAWQVAIDRNIVLERENEALRTELTKQQERNSPQCRTESI